MTSYVVHTFILSPNMHVLFQTNDFETPQIDFTFYFSLKATLMNWYLVIIIDSRPCITLKIQIQANNKMKPIRR